MNNTSGPFVQKTLSNETNHFRSCFLKAGKLFDSSQGVLLVFMMLFLCAKELFFYPLGRKIWSYALAATAPGFISNINFADALHYPHLILTGAFLLLFFYTLCMWEVSGILLFLEYRYRHKHVRFFPLLHLSFTNMLQVFRKENLLFAPYYLLIMPLVNLYNASGLISEYIIPEYIDQWIRSSWTTNLGYGLIYLFLLYLSLQWFFVLQEIFLKRRTFREACRESIRLIKGRKLLSFLRVGFFTMFRTIQMAWIPGILSVFAIGYSLFITRHLSGWMVAARFSYFLLFKQMFIAVTRTYLRMTIMCYLLICWHEAMKRSDVNPDFPMPEQGVKRSGRIRTFRRLYIGVYTGTVLLAMLAYLLTLEFLQVNPDFSHVIAGNADVIAHKGSCAHAPENTMDAFELAYTDGCSDWIELDVRESADGIPVVIHNASLKEAAGLKEEVYNLTYEQLQNIPAPYHFSKHRFPNAAIPSLEEVLQTYGGKIGLLIEIKDDPRTPLLPARTAELIRKYGIVSSCRIHSGSYTVLQRIKDAEPDLKCGLILAIGSGSYCSLPCADFFSVEHTFITNAAIDRIHDAGKEIYAWTVNESDALNAMIARNVDGIITDDPKQAYRTIHEADALVNEFLSAFETTPPADPEDSEYNAGNY